MLYYVFYLLNIQYRSIDYMQLVTVLSIRLTTIVTLRDAYNCLIYKEECAHLTFIVGLVGLTCCQCLRINLYSESIVRFLSNIVRFFRERIIVRRHGQPDDDDGLFDQAVHPFLRDFVSVLSACI